MLLRASGEVTGETVDVGAVTDPTRAEGSGIAHAAALIELAEALVANDDQALTRARERVLAEVGAPALVDTVAVASNFERMVRIADGTGIPLDEPVAILTSDIREQLGIDRFTAAANTPPPGVVRRILTPVLRPVLAHVFRRISRPNPSAGGH